MTLKKNDIIKLNIETCTVQGSGIGRFDGLAVFVPMTAPGDVIEAHILKVKPNCAFAKVHRIITPSPSRIPVDCAAYTKCGGCVFRHISYEEEARIKASHVADCLHRIGKTDIEPEKILTIGGRSTYRNKAQYPVARDGHELLMGFYSPHSHRVTECRFCPLQPKEFEGILNAFDGYIREQNISTYNEETHSGLLRHIYLRKAEATGQIMACAVINGTSLPNEGKLVEAIRNACPQTASIVININREKTNVILGKKCRTVYGSDYITDTLCGLSFRISPLSFYQVNRTGAEMLYRKAAEYARLDGTQTVLDLYCGAGTIGLSMKDKAKKIIGVEIVPEAIEDAKVNAALNNAENARFICADASEAAKQLENEGIRPDVIILDPPRKGCARDLLETVCSMSPDRIVYISCDPATQARDVNILEGLGYKALSACPVDMFPGTGHVESVVLLVKLPPDDVVNIELDLTKLPVSIHDGDATYDEIKQYVLSHHGLKVSSLYISQIKRKYGLKVTEAYNKPKSENSHQPQCPLEKEKAITEALKYFKMI